MKSICGAIPLLAMAITPTAFAADASAGRQDIQIVLTNYSFTPNMLHMQRNTPYTLHLMNSASGAHSFSAPALFAAATIAPDDRAKIADGKIEIPARQSVDIVLTPMSAGTYRITCTHTLHTMFGMHGQAVVE